MRRNAETIHSIRRHTAVAIVPFLLVLGVLGVASCKSDAPRTLTPLERAYQASVMSDLNALAREENMYYRLKHHFTNRADSTFFAQSIGVTAPVITITDSSWYATATHGQLPGVTCAIAVGHKNPIDASAADGAVVCK